MRKSITTFPKFLGVTLVLMLLNLAAWAQQVITGTVTDSKNGEPVAGVTVTIKGSSTSTQTDASGNFRINAASTNVTLVFSSVGFGTREVNSNGQTAISVALTQFNQQLNEVVVVGYGTARRRDLTGAVTVVSSKDFQKGAITTPEQLIAGKVAGVPIINNGGAPGAGSTIRIRGG
ncbi:MAG TPA: SusC/RagA family protein, partial [Chitinophagaceae bacterium]|nr:SusC/RagA family protein [Chitinophagaceae bacterium]